MIFQGRRDRTVTFSQLVLSSKGESLLTELLNNLWALVSAHQSEI